MSHYETIFDSDTPEHSILRVLADPTEEEDRRWTFEQIGGRLEVFQRVMRACFRRVGNHLDQLIPHAHGQVTLGVSVPGIEMLPTYKCHMEDLIIGMNKTFQDTASWIDKIANDVSLMPADFVFFGPTHEKAPALMGQHIRDLQGLEFGELQVQMVTQALDAIARFVDRGWGDSHYQFDHDSFTELMIELHANIPNKQAEEWGAETALKSIPRHEIHFRGTRGGRSKRDHEAPLLYLPRVSDVLADAEARLYDMQHSPLPKPVIIRDADD